MCLTSVSLSSYSRLRGQSRSPVYLVLSVLAATIVLSTCLPSPCTCIYTASWCTFIAAHPLTFHFLIDNVLTSFAPKVLEFVFRFDYFYLCRCICLVYREAKCIQPEVLNSNLNINVQYKHIIYGVCLYVLVYIYSVHTQACCIVFFVMLPIAIGSAVRNGQKLYTNISNCIW